MFCPLRIVRTCTRASSGGAQSPSCLFFLPDTQGHVLPDMQTTHSAGVREKTASDKKILEDADRDNRQLASLVLSVKRHSQLDSKGATTTLAVLCLIVAFMWLYVAAKSYTLMMEWPHVFTWFRAGFHTSPPASKSVSALEICMASEFSGMYKYFGILKGWSGRLERRQAQFLLLSLADLCTRPGFSGIHLCGSPQQLNAVHMSKFLGIGIGDVATRAKAWYDDSNPWKLLYDSGETLMTNYAWKEVYRITMGEKNKQPVESSYMWSLFNGGLLQVATDHISRDDKLTVQQHMQRLYGGSALVIRPSCGWAKAKKAVDAAATGLMIGGMLGGHISVRAMTEEGSKASEVIAACAKTVVAGAVAGGVSAYAVHSSSSSLC
jgi:hypothetical protein